MAADPLTERTVTELLNYDASDNDDLFADNTITISRDDKATLSPRAQKRKVDDNKENDGLGLDEEVKITKKRKPIAKLDEERLLNEQGVPKLRALARSGKISKKLRLKGKGYEFADAGKLLNYYQLWLDDLYPRAKFADGLQLVEKVGHSKRMQVMRKEWIDEGKPGYIRNRELGMNRDEVANTISSSEHARIPQNYTNAGKRVQQSNEANEPIFDNDADSDDLFFPDTEHHTKQNDPLQPDDDELDALLAVPSRTTNLARAVAREDSEGEDDLDALLAVQSRERTQAKIPVWSANPRQGIDEDEEDDLDAIIAEQEARNKPATTQPQVRTVVFDGDEDSEDDLDALLAERETSKGATLLEFSQSLGPAAKGGNEVPMQDESGSQSQVEKILSSSPLPNEVEDLDALFEEHEQQKEGVKQQDESEAHDLLSSPIPNDDLDLEAENESLQD